MKKIFIFSMISLSSILYSQENVKVTENTSSTEFVRKATIEEGTLVKAALKNEIRGGKMKVGDQVEFYLKQPISVGDQVVVGEGKKIIGTVTEARASGIVGRKGKLAFNIEYLYLDNGQIIKLTGQNSKNLKGSGAVVAATAVLLTPLALFIPGKGAKFEKDTEFEAYVAKDTELR